MDSKYFLSKHGNKDSDLVVEINEKDEESVVAISSKKLLVCKVVLLVLVAVLTLADLSMLSPFR